MATHLQRNANRMLAFVPSGAKDLYRHAYQRGVFCPSSTRFSSHSIGARRRLRWLISPRRNTSPRMDVVVEGEVDPGAVEGTSLRILKYPHPLLRAGNATVAEDEFNDKLKQTAREMLKIMYASRGVGLAAPQVGVNIRLLVFNPEGDSKAFLQEVVMVNPVIVGSSKRTEVEPEACLSFPGMSGNVRRHEWVKVEGYRLNGKKFRVKYEGWKARIFQHEFDHLEGVMYIDRLSDEDRESVKQRLDELIQDYNNNRYQDKQAAL